MKKRGTQIIHERKRKLKKRERERERERKYPFSGEKSL